MCQPEGYGNDDHITLDAFPFSKKLNRPTDDDTELLKKLRHMGKGIYFYCCLIT